MQCSASMTASSTPLEPTCASCGTKNPAAAKYCLNCATPLHAATPAAGLTGLLPQNFLLNGRYAIVKRLGKGGMGAVYQATDTRIGGKVWAIKEMSDAALLNPVDKQQARDAFQREAQMLALLDHHNLPKVNDFFTEDGKLYLVMDYIEGQTLDELLEASAGPLPEAQVIDWAGQLCDVLSYLHGRTPPIIFRDLKPGNLMVDASGRVKLIDFGVARLFKIGKQRDTESFGTAGYAPPEQYGKGQTDARSDVYALGVTLHQLLTNYDPTLTPFNLPPARSVNPAVSAHVDQALTKATQSAPANRHQNALEFKTVLLSAPKRPVKATVAATTPPVVQPNPVVQPVTISPTIAPQPIATPKAVGSRPAQAIGGRQASSTVLVLVSGLIGLLLGIAMVLVGPLTGGWLGFAFWFAAGPLAYALFRRSSAFSIAWIVAAMAPLFSGFRLVEMLPLIGIPIFGFAILALRRPQGSIKSTAFASTLTVIGAWLVIEIIFGYGFSSVNTYLLIGSTSLVSGFLGGWLGRALRNRIGWV